MADRDVSLRLAVVDAQAAIRRLREFGAQGDAALRKIDASAKPAAAGLVAVNRSSIALQSTMARLAPSLAVFGGGLAGIALGGVTALGAGLAVGVKNAEEAQRSLRRLEGVLRATGSSAGLTVQEIAALGDELERTTLASGEAVVDASAALATFKSVSGDTFTDAIRLSQDLAATFGGDLVSTATQLGKALEDPIRGLDSLREKGVTFSAAQRDVIEALVETGQTAEAQRKILEALEGQVGGAGAAEASGLTGAFSALRAELGDLLQDFGEMTGAAGLLEEALRNAARGLGAVRETFADDPFGDLARVQGEIAALQERLAAGDPAGGLRGAALAGLDRADLEAQIEALREQERAIGRVIAAQQGAAVVARVAAAEAAEAAEAERQADQRRAVAADVTKRSAEAEKKAREEAVAAAARQAEAAAKAIADARIALDQQTRLRAALEDSVEAHEAVAAAIEVETAVRRAGLDVESEQGMVLAGLVEQRQAEADAIEKVNAARARLARLEDESRRRLEDRGFNPESSAADYRRGQEQSQADNAREAERMAQIYTDVFARAVDRIGETFSDTLAEYRNGELDNFEDFAASIGDIMAAPFEQLSGAVFSSLFEGIVADLSTQIKSAAASGQFDIAGLAGAFNNPLGAAALGASIGGIGAQALGIGNQYTSLGGGLGSGLGFAAGTALFGPAGGIAGGILGGILGTGIASTFGGGGQRDNVGTSVFLDDLRVNAGGTPNQNTNRAEQIGAQVAGVIQGLRAQGIEFDAGGKIRFNVNNTRSDADILQGATRQLRELSQTDDPLLRQVLEASSAKSPTALLGDIEFARFFEQLTGAAGPAEEALRALNVQFDEAARRARELGLDEAALAEARERATQDLVRSTEDAVLAQADQIRAIFEGRTAPLQSAIDSITIGTDSALSTQEQLDLVRSQFDALVAEADAGRDIDFNRLAGLGQQVVGLSREFDASGALFQEAFRDVNSTLQRVIEEQTGRQDDLLSALPDALRDAQRDQTAVLAERLDKMVGELERLTRTVEIQGRVA